MHTLIQRSLLRATGALMLVIAASSQLTLCQEAPQRTFASPGQAANALYETLKSGDDVAVRQILGSADLIGTANANDERRNREQFVQKYEEMHRIVREPDGTAVLYVGAENWPFPIPLTPNGAAWLFDPDAGTAEMTAREIGENEITAISVCQTFAKNTPPASEDTILDRAVHQVVTNLNEITGTSIGPFHGYFFRLTTTASGSGRIVAYPAEYGISGIMSFTGIKGHAVYENDLGINTAQAVQQTDGKPQGSWGPVR
jgi:Protein of unknown function (DUF2950)